MKVFCRVDYSFLLFCPHVIIAAGRQAKPGFQPRYGFKTTMEARGLGSLSFPFLGFRFF